MLTSMLSCGHGQQNAQKQSNADSLIDAAFDSSDYERVLALCDSLEQRGDISLFKAALERGVAYYSLDKEKLANDELEKALTETPKNEIDSLIFYQCVCNLASGYNFSGNDEALLQLALPKIEELKVWAEKKPSNQIFKNLRTLTNYVGQGQLRLGMKKEAEKVYELSIQYMDKIKKELFGDERLLDTMTGLKDLNSHQVIDKLKEAVEQHRNGAEPSWCSPNFH